jgi:signal transduction histidine kinase/CheY-like chemotaxis protein
MKALVVDDNPAERELVARLLRRYGWRVEEAETGRQALEKLAGVEPDLIVSDGMMPDMDGFQLLREIRRNADEIAFVFYSGIYTGGPERDLALSLGADAFIQKPCPPAGLIREIVAVMERKRQGESPRETGMDEETYLRRYSAVLSSKLQQKVVEMEKTRTMEPGNARLDSEILRRRKDLDEIVRAEAELEKKKRISASPLELFPPEMRDASYLLPRLTLPLDCIDSTVGSFLARFDGRMGEERNAYLRNIELSSQGMRRMAEYMLKSPDVSRREVHQQLKRLEVFGGMLARSSGGLGEEAEVLARRIAGCCAEMRRLVDDVLDLFTVSAVEVRRERIDMSGIAAKVLRELSDAEPERHVAVTVEEGCVAVADRQLIRILLENLLENAWKFTRNVPSPEIRFGVGTGAQRSFFVGDNGIGFPPAEAERVFRPFVRLHADEDYPGTGIGLTIARAIVLRHGGAITAGGEPGKGAVFSFSIPRSL